MGTAIDDHLPINTHGTAYLNPSVATSFSPHTKHSLHSVINDRGVRQVYTPVVSKIHVPPRIHVFLWLLANNKILTRDNLAKRKEVDDKSCLFCSENETAGHLLYECIAARYMWEIVSEVTELPLIIDYELMAKWWIRHKKLNAVNVFYTAVVWPL
jgi:hypothetical protein